MMYQVTGRVESVIHGRAKFLAEVQETVEAHSDEQAADKALNRMMTRHLEPLRWAGAPTVGPLPEDQVMRRMGAPVLPGLEVL